MPPKQKTDREQIILAAAGVIREGGEQALNVRSVAAALGVSTQPIFSNFKNMEELREAVISHAREVCSAYMHEAASDPDIPPYKATGLGLIRFADEEKELFKLLFMRDRRDEIIPDDDTTLDPVIGLIMQATGLSREQAKRFHLEMWIFVHGIASMVATNYIKLDLEAASGMLTDVYQGLLTRYRGE